MIRDYRGVQDLGLVLLYVSYRPCLHDRSRAGIYLPHQYQDTSECNTIT